MMSKPNYTESVFFVVVHIGMIVVVVLILVVKFILGLIMANKV